jgi:hypothetical protein
MIGPHRATFRERITVSWWVSCSIVLLLCIAWCTGLDFRLGRAYWDHRLSATVGDEELATAYASIGRRGGSAAAYSFLRDHLSRELERDANDVVLQGIIRGICSTRRDEAERLLSQTFETNCEIPGREYVAVLAAWGIQCLASDTFELVVPDSLPEMYSAFAIGGFASSGDRADAEARFEQLKVEVRGRRGQ